MFREVLVSTLSRVLGLVSSLVLIRVSSDHLSKEDQAVFIILISLATFVPILGNLGLQQSAVRDLAKFKGDDLKIESSKFFSSFPISFCVAALLFLFITQFISDTHSKIFIIGAVWIGALSSQNLIGEIVRANKGNISSAFHNGITYSIFVLLSVGFLIFEGIISIYNMLLVLTLSCIFSILISIIFAAPYRLKWDFKFICNKVSNSFPSLITTASVMLIMQLDSWVAKRYFQSSESLDYIQVARLMIIVSSSAGMFNILFSKRFALAYLKGAGELLFIVKKIFLLYIILGLFMISLVYLGRDSIFNLIYSKPMGQNAFFLPLLIANAAVILTSFSGIALTMMGKQKILAGISVFFCFTSIAGTLLSYFYHSLNILAWSVTANWTIMQLFILSSLICILVKENRKYEDSSTHKVSSIQ